MAEIVLFQDVDNQPDPGLTLNGSVASLVTQEFNDRISSLRVTAGTFTLFENRDFQGNSFTVCSRGGPQSNGVYPSPSAVSQMSGRLSSIPCGRI
jgi:beta/gamma crystallin